MSKPESFMRVDRLEKAIVAHVLKAELDHAATLQVKSELKTLIASTSELPMIINMDQVKFLPSVALGALVEIHLDMRRAGRRFALSGLQPAVDDLVRLSGLDNLLQIYQQTDAALAQV